MQEHGFNRDQFVNVLGYRNITKGRRGLDPWLDRGGGDDIILKQITAKYPEHATGLEDAVTATKEIRAAKAKAEFLEYCKTEQKSFRPYIHVEGETTVPNGITLFGVTGGRWNLIDMPQAILDLALSDQLAALPELMRTYLREYNGACPFFGKVTGFRYVRCFDYFQFDKDGTLVNM